MSGSTRGSESAYHLQAGSLSWGRNCPAQHWVTALNDRSQQWPKPPSSATSLLPFGNGRSYGDVGLNPDGALLLTRGLDRFIDFDPATGRLRCEAGVLLDDILRIIVPQGWFLPVTPGTRFVTVGGAIANDVHGKNHHRAGCFGQHITALELLRSDGTRRICSPSQNFDWFSATCGGLGLTGLITWAEIQCRPIHNPWMLGYQQRFNDLAQFFALSEAADAAYEYHVAWIDCASQGSQLGRGIFMAANHAPEGFQPPHPHHPKTLTFPFTPPISLVNGLSLKLFNELYFHRIRTGQQPLVQHYEPFFYPLDGLLEWNKMYGPKGFHQYQCVVPNQAHLPALDTVKALLQCISQSGQGSFLAVLKTCGEITSPAQLSFPMPGISLALDFPERGAALSALFAELDALVLNAGGRLYPAKDSRMPAALFQTGYPQYAEFSAYIDPAFSSGFWRRVTQTV